MKLEEITVGSAIRGVLPSGVVVVVAVEWIGEVAIQLTYRDASGRVGEELLYRDREPSLELAQAGRPWSFDGNPALFRLVSEAHRIRLAHLFDPLLAVHTSIVQPLPHQITAVYEEMLPRQPLRFLLADDPGAGKTIMTGLFLKELLARGDLQRCLIVCPGNLAEQWQDEMDSKFSLPFSIMTNDAMEAARTGNWFFETPLAICRLDKLSRNESIQEKLRQVDWDLVVCDESHKMSATYFGNEVKYTKRYRLGQLLSGVTRHFLLLTATPHNGKEADFQLFLALLDGDRFEGKFRDGVHLADSSDLMRRLVKEQLLKFDGTPLFPERRAYTVGYKLSDAEADLYDRVTRYVKEEFDRASALENGGQKGTVGFALTILQRRLASSPEAIYQSLRRRRERLQKRLREEQLATRVAQARIDLNDQLPIYEEEDIDELEEAPDAELEAVEEKVVDQASAARTIAELQTEIRMLQDLEEAALHVRQSGTDRKWDELSRLLGSEAMFDANGHRRKLVIFTEQRDTLNYLADRIRSSLGQSEAVVEIHGGLGREERKKIQEAFTQDKEVQILVATDAAGEGINLQRAHLMVNYDLPWNPNRLEQRFGRIHRIGQTEVCHLWNLVARETREGDVYHRLLEKIDEERKALGGQVFDVLGELTFDNKPLRELLIEAIRYGDQPQVRDRLYQVVDKALDRGHLQSLLENRALTHDSMDISRVRQIREEMERADARRLQPHFIAGFFMQAFQLLGGTIHEREQKRYEIKHVPAVIRNRDRVIGRGQPVLQRYERITFDKEEISIPGKPVAAFVCPGHPLLDATIDLVIERHRDLLKQGAILIDERDNSVEPRALVYVEHSIQDARVDDSGNRRVISRRWQFVEIWASGDARSGGPAPFLDYRPPHEEEQSLLTELCNVPWLRNDLEVFATRYAAVHLVPSHFTEVKQFREQLIDKTMAAVKERLTKEITHWDNRAVRLKEEELAGRVNAKLNSGKARQICEELTARLQKRLEELQRERQLSPLPPIVVGGALIVPIGLIHKLKGESPHNSNEATVETSAAEQAAMQAVLETERRLGFVPRDVSQEKLGYDIESSVAGTGRLRFLEVKGRVAGAKTVTITKNEILTALNKPDDFILAIVELDEDQRVPRYIRKPFAAEPDFGVTSVNYDLRELLSRSQDPG